MDWLTTNVPVKAACVAVERVIRKSRSYSLSLTAVLCYEYVWFHEPRRLLIHRWLAPDRPFAPGRCGCYWVWAHRGLAVINIYVGNLPYDTTADELRTLFEPFGDVNRSTIVFDRDTGRSRGFGFVEMEDEDAGRKAIEKLAGEPWNGRPLTINEARNSRKDRDDETGAPASSGDSIQTGGYSNAYLNRSA